MASDLATATVQHERSMEGYVGPSVMAVQPVQLRPARRIELVSHLSGAFDLAEGQPVGHAARVAYVALAVARRLGLDSKLRQRVAYVALLHDAGIPVRGATPRRGRGRRACWTWTRKCSRQYGRRTSAGTVRAVRTAWR